VPVTALAVKYRERNANPSHGAHRAGNAMVVGRIIGWLFVLAAIAAAARDMVAWYDTGTYQAMPLGQLWFELDKASLNLVQAVIQRYLMPELWDPVIVSLLLAPAWSVFAVPAIVLLVLCRRRQ
jgi:hypothetical protein